MSKGGESHGQAGIRRHAGATAGRLCGGEFRALWTAYALSVAGDQLAAVGLSVLVFDRTGSPAWAAATYAMTFLPDLTGGALLSGLADRFPRRRISSTGPGVNHPHLPN